MNEKVVRWFVAGCLLAGAALFVVGVTREGEDADITDEAAEFTEQSEDPGTEASASNEALEEAEAESDETVLGIDVESPAVVTLAFVLGFGLAMAALFWPSRPLWIAILVFALVALVFDMGEIAHQISEDQMGIAGLAAVVGLLHLGAAGGAGMLLAGPRSVDAEPSRD